MQDELRNFGFEKYLLIDLEARIESRQNQIASQFEQSQKKMHHEINIIVKEIFAGGENDSNMNAGV